MYFIRTKKNKYDIDVIVDVTSDVSYKNVTAFTWIEADIPSPGPTKGNYWLDGESIALDSASYSKIQTIIESIEAPLKVSRIAAEPPDADAVVRTIEFEAIPGPGGASARARQLETQAQMDIAKSSALKSDADINDPQNLDSPEDLVSTSANYDHYVEQLADIDVMVAGLSSSSNYTLTPAATSTDHTKLVFDPPLEFDHKEADGETNQTVSELIVPPADVGSGNDISDYIQYWTDLRAKVLAVKDKMKTDLGL